MLLDLPELFRAFAGYDDVRLVLLLMLRLVRLDHDVLQLLRRLFDLAGEEQAGVGDHEAVVLLVRIVEVEAVVEDDRGRDRQLRPARRGNE